jgi:Histone methylation protein DOT1
MSNKVVRLVRRIKAGGLGIALILIAKNLPRSLREWLIRHRVSEHEQFDLKYGVDTQSRVQVSELEQSAPVVQFANRYEATPIAALHKIIRGLKVDRSHFTFIDLGSGKGRVLLIAGLYRFKAVIGVEFSHKLHNIALRNIKRFRDLGLTHTHICSFNCDAAEFDFSSVKDKIVFCYNPFAAELIGRVLDNIEAGQVQDRKTIFVYLGPIPASISDRLSRFPLIRFGEVLSEFGFFEPYSVYKIR